MDDEAITLLNSCGKWAPERRLTLEEIKAIEKKPIFGVYAILADKPINRTSGKNRILYIGQSAKEGVAGRLESIVNPTYQGYHEDVAKALKTLKDKGICDEHSFTYIETDKTKSLEKALLNKYEELHLELPPLNKQRG